jgi:large conductance mechanosensitive channel
MLREFREFALKGNLVDLAVAFVIGAAFTRLSTSFIESLIMPLVGLLTPGDLDFSDEYWVLKGNVTAGAPLADARAQGTVLAYGEFFSVTLNFVIVAFAMFLVVKAINRAKRLTEVPMPPPAPVEPPAEEKLLREIRDLLKDRP